MKSFQKKYPNINLNDIPRKILDSLDDAEVTGNSNKIIKLSNGEKYHLNNKLNDLNGSEWTYFTSSLITTNYSTKGSESDAHDIRKIHPSPKPPKLLREIISFFTKEGDKVFDFFMGVGGTLIAASQLKRRAVGIELEKRYIEAYENACKKLSIPSQRVIHGDSLKILQDKTIMGDLFEDGLSKLILIDPPYFDMMSKAKTGQDIKKYGRKSTPFSESKFDLGNMKEEDFWLSIKNSVELSLEFLSISGHIIVFIKDLQPTEKSLNMLHYKMADVISSISGVRYIGMKIWADMNIKLFPYGYPYSFVPNQLHSYILIFKKMF